MLLPRLAWSRALLLGICLIAAGRRAAADPSPPAGDRPPELLQSDKPEYPLAMRDRGNTGTVLVGLLIDPAGKVVQVRAIESSHPEFEAALVDAVLKWTYRPALRDGKPVAARITLPWTFIYRDRHWAGIDVVHFPPTAPATLPPQFQYDRAPVALLVAAPVYPLDLLAARVEGKATVTYAIDPAGRTRIFRVDSATDPAFAAATCAMVLAWEFKPAQKAGSPCWALVTRQQTFAYDSADFPVSYAAKRLLKELHRTPCPIVRDGLDAKLVARFKPPAKLPESVVKAHVPASAVVEVVVDQDGHARLPRLVSATNDDFGWAAMTAVARWVYTVPTQGGKPVDAFLQIPFSWAPSPAPAQGT